MRNLILPDPEILPYSFICKSLDAEKHIITVWGLGYKWEA